MTQFLQLLFTGISLGSTYALIALAVRSGAHPNNGNAMTTDHATSGG